MKRGTKLLILLVALVVLAGVWILAANLSNRRLENTVVEENTETYDLSVGDSEAIDAISWTYLDTSVRLSYDEEADAWINVEDASCPIDSDAVASLVEAVSAVTADGAIEDVEDFEQYGLDEPALTVTAAAGDSTVTYAVGSINSLTGEYYVRVDEENTVYTETGALTAFQTGIEGVLAMEGVPGDGREFMTLSVETDMESYVLTTQPELTSVRYGGGNYTWFNLDTETGICTPLETEQAQALCAEAAAVSFLSCETWAAEDLSLYGLDDPQGRATVTYLDDDGEEQAFSLEFGDYVGSYVYVRIAGSSMVYLASGTVLDALMAPDWDAMTPLEVAPVDTESLSELTVTLDGQTYEIAAAQELSLETVETEDEDGEITETTEEVIHISYACNGAELDADAMDTWLANLTALTAESLSDAADGREELLTVTLLLNEEEAEETEEEFEEELSAQEESTASPEAEAGSGTAITLSFWSYNSTDCLCLTDDGMAYFVSRTAAENLVSQLESVLMPEDETETETETETD